LPSLFFAGNESRKVILFGMDKPYFTAGRDGMLECAMGVLWKEGVFKLREIEKYSIKTMN
jgi:hypothetical protein